MSLHHMLRAAAGSAPSDPYFENVTLLLTGDGTNGAQNNTFLDSSTNNFTITRNGNTTQGTFSPYGNLWSNYFDGTGDYIDVPAFTMSGDFTVECWVYKTSVDASGYTVLFGNNAGGVENQFSIDQTTAGSIGLYSGATVISPSGTAVTNNVWHHLAWVRQGTTCRAYVDGVQQGTGTKSGDVQFKRIGAYNGGGYELNGYLSNVRVVSGTCLYPSGTTFTPSITPLTAVSGTSLLTCQSNRFIDNSSNNFTLTVNGNTSVQRFSPFNPTAPYSAATIGGSGYFDGSGDYLSRAFTSTTDGMYLQGTTYTIEAWIYMTSTSGIQEIYCCSAANVSSFGAVALYVNSGVLGFNTRPTTGGGESGTTGGTVVANTWNHVSASVSAGSARLFLNGTQVGSTTTVQAATFTPVGAAIGRIPNGYTTGITDFTGYISNLRIVQGQALYTSNFTPPTAPLTAITNTSLLTNFTNAGIPDAAMMNDLETVGNAQVSTSVVKYGTGSLKFDGTGDWLITQSAAVSSLGTGDFTFESWLYPTSFTTATLFRRWFSFGTGLANDFTVNMDTSGYLVFRINDAIQLTSTTALTLNTWQHVAIARSSGTVRFFVNGTVAGSATVTTNVSAQGASPLYIGAEAGYSTAGSSGDYIGYMDDFRITKGLARYTANFTPPTAALPTY